MSKKTAIIIIIIVILLVSGGLLAFYFYAKKNNPVNSNPVINKPAIENPFPESNGNQTPTQPNNQNENNGTQTENSFVPVLKELSQRPSAGVSVPVSSSTTFVNFVERGTGNVYQVSPNSDNEERLTNTTIPKIEEAIWDKNSKKVIIRYEDEEGDIIKTYSGFIDEKNSEHPDGALGGAFIPEGIKSITTNPEKDKIFYLLNSSTGSNGIIADFENNKKLQIFESPLQSFNLDWPSTNIITLTTKPSYSSPGMMFMLNTKTGQLTKAISNINGLTAKLDTKAERAIYSESTSSGLNFKIYSFKTAKIVETPVSTLPEKCVWSKNNTEVVYCSVPSYIPPGYYPDSWYRGQILFSDEIWKINTDTGSGELLLKLKDYAKKDIDGINLTLSPKEDFLIITNKIDFHLWSLKLSSSN